MQTDNKRTIFGWALYDWANSAFATTVMAGFFPLFFKQYWSAGADVNISTARLGLANSIAGIVVALCAPVLGAIADRGTSKKKFLLFFTYLGIVMTSSLYMVSMGNWPMAVMLYVLANVGFASGNVFYDSLLTGVASEDRLHLVSSLGFGLGYLGGGILFALNVWMMLSPGTFGFADSAEAVRFSFLTVGVWWAVFSVPVFLFVKEPVGRDTRSGIRAVKAGLAQLRETFHEIRHLKTIFLFLAAYWLYIDGVDTIIRMAVDYGISIGGGRIGERRAIFIAIGVYLFVSVWGAFMTDKSEFYMLAVIIGLVQGGIQALSRSFYAKIIPVSKSAEYFGFYNMLGKFAAVLGPVIMGGAGLLVRNMGYSSDIASRAGITSIAIFFIAGGTLFYFVDEEKGRAEVKYLEDG
jgi:UMF1 family MFS transporter